MHDYTLRFQVHSVYRLHLASVSSIGDMIKTSQYSRPRKDHTLQCVYRTWWRILILIVMNLVLISPSLWIKYISVSWETHIASSHLHWVCLVFSRLARVNSTKIGGNAWDKQKEDSSGSADPRVSRDIQDSNKTMVIFFFTNKAYYLCD